MNKILLLIWILLFCFLSCSGKGSLESGISKVSVIIDGTFDDKSFNESALNGIKKLKRNLRLSLF